MGVVAGPVSGLEASAEVAGARAALPAGTKAWLTAAIRRVKVVQPLGAGLSLLIQLLVEVLPWLAVMATVPVGVAIGAPRLKRMIAPWQGRGYTEWQLSVAATAARRGRPAPESLQPVASEMAASLLQLYDDPRRTLRSNWPWLIPAAVPLAVDAVLLAVFGPRLPPGSEVWWIVFFLDFLLFLVAIAGSWRHSKIRSTW